MTTVNNSTSDNTSTQNTCVNSCCNVNNTSNSTYTKQSQENHVHNSGSSHIVRYNKVSNSTQVATVSGALNPLTQALRTEKLGGIMHNQHISYDEKLKAIRSQPKNMSPINASKHPTLIPRNIKNTKKKTLVIDLDETLVHSSYNKIHKFDLHLPLTINRTICNVYVAFRPYLHSFLQAMAPIFEIVIYTASVSVYCDPLMNCIDKHNILGPLRLYREHCSRVGGSYVKDLSLLGRPLDQVCIIDNSPVAYLFQPRNAIPIISWFDDPNDTELLKLIPFLQTMAASNNTIYHFLDPYNASITDNIPSLTAISHCNQSLQPVTTTSQYQT